MSRIVVDLFQNRWPILAPHLSLSIPSKWGLTVFDSARHTITRSSIPSASLVDDIGTARILQGVLQAVHIPPVGSLPDNSCFIPAGWFWAGGDEAELNSYSRKRIWLEDYIMSTYPVTNREYLVYLNALVDAGQVDEALLRVPRERSGQVGQEGAMIYGRDSNGHFILVPDADGDLWDLDWPVMMVDWHSANAYAEWYSAKTGRRWMLPDELRWEKAARGVDGRWHVWGDRFDPSYCAMVHSHNGRRLPQPIDSFEIDCSVYGVRGMGGNMVDWTAPAGARTGI